MSTIDHVLLETKKLCDMFRQTGNLVKAICTHLIDREDDMSLQDEQSSIPYHINTLLDKIYVSDLLEITIMILLAENNLSEVNCFTLKQYLANAIWWQKTNMAKGCMELLSAAFTDTVIEYEH